MAQYDLGKVSIRPRGAYAANTNYEFLDSVQNLGGSWLALAASKDVQPGVTAGWQNYWMMFTKGIKTIAGSSAGSGQTTLTITFSDGSTQTYTYDNEVLADGSVGTAQLAPNAVTGDKIAVGAVTGRYAVTIPSAAASWARWNGSSSNAWYTDLTATGVKSTDRGDLFLQRGISSYATPSLAAFEQDAENFSHIVAANITADNTLRVFADEIPANNIYCYLRVVKK